ncbi:DUF2306 domain-containing protein [Burkholderiaceae bacterium DAT-1]|nr:DUF2306 domain-containing protein [Burkholderiaceae bacterium DAT-1]
MGLIRQGLLALLAFGVAGYALFVYGTMPIGALVHPSMRLTFAAHATAVYIHAFASSIALIIGPLQFSGRIRRRWPQVHRWMGRIYLGVGILAGGVSALYIAQFAYGGLPSRLGFSSLALLWLYTGYHAYSAIRAGNIKQHRTWMLRNVCLTYAAVTLRIYLPVSLVAQLNFDVTYPAISWLCWVPNALFAEWYVRRSKNVAV